MTIESSRHYVITAENDDTLKHFRKYESGNITFSASGQYSKNGLEALQKHISTASCTIVNLREETSIFADGRAITVYQSDENNANKDMSIHEIKALEKHFIHEIESAKEITVSIRKKEKKENGKAIHFETGEKITVEKAQSEKEVVKGHHLSYTYLPVTDHSMKALALKIDEIVTLILSSEKKWFHFHCQGGKARSAMAMTLAIILVEAKNKPLKEIEALFSQNAFYFEARKYKKFKEFFGYFYTYCRTENPETTQWSQWAKKNNVYERSLAILPESRKDKPRAKSLRINSTKEE